uniref:uncharacterized protein LOC120326670 n=1 Tax=Styela clava TaxID=7725 RepID=UPI0019399AA3|nr:uncharacterized protein LOC120326670 [Styela clava]
MHSKSGRNLCLFAIVTICFLAISHGSPVPDLESDKDANVTDTTTASPLTTITQSVISQGTKGKADKARECALQAIRIIVSDLDGPVDEECRQILKTMTINAGKHKEENNPVDDVDLRKELKEIAQREVQYQNMNDEIDQAENLNAENDLIQMKNWRSLHHEMMTQLYLPWNQKKKLLRVLKTNKMP